MLVGCLRRGWNRDRTRGRYALMTNTWVKAQAAVKGKKNSPECDTQGNYCGPSRATDPRNPCGTRVYKTATSNPPPGYNPPDK